MVFLGVQVHHELCYNLKRGLQIITGDNNEDNTIKRAAGPNESITKWLGIGIGSCRYGEPKRNRAHVSLVKVQDNDHWTKLSLFVLPGRKVQFLQAIVNERNQGTPTATSQKSTCVPRTEAQATTPFLAPRSDSTN